MAGVGVAVMYAVALLLSAGVTAGTSGLPDFQLGALDIGIPIQSFGMIVAAGVLIGAALLRRYAEWHGVSDDHIRGLTGWITVTGFIGAHVFDVVAYQSDKLATDPLLFFKLWDGISSYGGFVGGAIGFALYVWWKRLNPRLMADIGIVGLLPAFSIGRIGCTVVSDHIGSMVDAPGKWYAFLAMDYPRALNMGGLAERYPGSSEYIRAWNLGLVEFLYLVPVNALMLYLAFRKKRIASGLIIVTVAALYAPVRFFLDFLRPDQSDPRYGGLTFAQWAAIASFGIALYVMARIIKHGEPAETIAPTSREAMRKLRADAVAERDADAGEEAEGVKKKKKTAASVKKS